MAIESNNMGTMQQEAIRRVQEMQRRAQQSLHNTTPHEPQQPVSEPPIIRETPAERHPANPITDIFETLMQDQERTLILVLLLLLIEEKSDTSVIFALMYLVL